MLKLHHISVIYLNQHFRFGALQNVNVPLASVQFFYVGRRKLIGGKFVSKSINNTLLSSS